MKPTSRIGSIKCRLLFSKKVYHVIGNKSVGESHMQASIGIKKDLAREDEIIITVLELE